jgi:hypothetical protein
MTVILRLINSYIAKLRLKRSLQELARGAVRPIDQVLERARR